MQEMPHPLLRQRYAGTNKDDNALGRSENGAIPSKHRNKTFNKTFILGNIHPQEQGLNGSFLVARTDMPNFDYGGIEGSSVLMGRKGGMPAMILQYVLNNKGYTDGVNITMDYSIQFGALGPAFTGGTGDFVPLFEPAASQLVQEGKGYIVSAIGMDSGEIPYTCYTATAEFLKDNSEKVEKFLRAVWRGTEYALCHSAEDCARLVAPYFEGTTLELLTTAIQNYQDFDVWTVTPVTDREAFSRIQDIMENAGELSQRVDYEKIVDNTCANKISPVK